MSLQAKIILMEQNLNAKSTFILGQRDYLLILLIFIYSKSIKLVINISYFKEKPELPCKY